MSYVLALALATTALPSIEDVINWLPANTETLMVARKAGRMEEIKGKATGAQEARHLLTVGLPGEKPADVKIDYEFVVNGSRAFKPPKQFGLFTYQGCKIIGLKPNEHARLQAQFKKSGRRIKVEGQDAYELSQKLEHDRWSYHILFLDGLMFCATDRNYLAEVLKRRSGRRVGRAFPETLPQWKFINKQAPFWVVRHVRPDNKVGVNIGDPKLVGYAMSLTRDERQFRVVSLSNNPQGFELAREMWQGFMKREKASPPTIRRLSPRATQFTFAGDKFYEGRMLFVLLAAVGTPVYL